MPVSEAVQRARQERYDRRMEAAREVVPHGLYCYERMGEPKKVTLADGSETMVWPAKTCPYWKHRPDKPAQRNGYCRLLKVGDFTPRPRGTMLLWDQCKECGINMDEPEENLA